MDETRRAANTISTAEHTFSLILSLARKIPQAHALDGGGEVGPENRSRGTELCGKVLGIVGMGRIGGEVRAPGPSPSA